MAFVDQSAFSEGPERKCPDQFGGLLAVFPATPLDPHERAGYRFRPHICGEAIAYDPDYCTPGDIKKDPDTFGPEKEAVLGLIQSAVNCSVGATMDELREEARKAISENLERAIEADLVAYLIANTTDTLLGPFDPKCGLAEASQFLATSSECGRGLIIGPVGWFVQLENTLVWQPSKGYHTDYVGNIVIPHSMDNSTVFALDLSMDIKTSDIQLLDETFPGTRLVNDRIVRAEQLYTVAVDACAIASITVNDCCACGGGGGGGGGGGVQNPCNCQFQVTNFPANQNVTVTNFPPTSPELDVENLILCDVDSDFNVVGSALLVYTYDETTGLPTGVPQIVDPVTGGPYVVQGTLQPCPGNRPATVTAQHFDTIPGTPWTPALSGGLIITSVTLTVLTGTATITDANGDVVAGIPAPYSGTWSSDPNGKLVTPQSIAADPGSRVYVIWNELTV